MLPGVVPVGAVPPVVPVFAADESPSRPAEVEPRFTGAVIGATTWVPEPIPSEPALFNPHIHHAVEMVDTKDHPDQTILDEYQKGYYFKGRLLRPAMVKVAVNQ